MKQVVKLNVTQKTPHKQTSPERATKITSSSGASFHPRNRHQGQYDFTRLLQEEPGLEAFFVRNAHEQISIDFSNNTAVKMLNRALLKSDYGVQHWDIPDGNLCPPIPGRVDYIHALADVLSQSNNGKTPPGNKITVLDIGTGANCIYPLLGYAEYAWQFVASELNPASFAHAQSILTANPRFATKITLRQQLQPKAIFDGIINADDYFDLSMCNPPFHSSAESAAEGSQRKWRQLGKEQHAQAQVLNFGGQDSELWCEGGEAAFLQRMIEESTRYSAQCFWFSSLVSKAENLPALQRQLKKVNATQVVVVPMQQGQKQSRFIAWTFFNPAQQKTWRQLRWQR